MTQTIGLIERAAARLHPQEVSEPVPAEALRAVRDMGGSTKGRKGDVDALAATVLLQHALALFESDRAGVRLRGTDD